MPLKEALKHLFQAESIISQLSYDCINQALADYRTEFTRLRNCLSMAEHQISEWSDKERINKRVPE